MVLLEDETETDDPSVIGDEAHIVAREDAGPRGDPSFPHEKRDRFDNLLLLCKNHHKMIDDQPVLYSVDKLREMKVSHLQWVDDNLDPDKNKQREEEVYASYVECWLELGMIADWSRWTAYVFWANGPRMDVKTMESLEILDEYLAARIWPGLYPVLESSFLNFRNVLRDFRGVFMTYAIDVGTDTKKEYWTEKIYHLPDYDEELYREKAVEYDFHVRLTLDLMLELTRAANLICDNVRSFLTRSFRMEEGALMVLANPDGVFNENAICPKYKDSQQREVKYPGLILFMQTRDQRDYSYGRGVGNRYGLLESENI